MNTSKDNTAIDTQKRNIILFVTTIGSFLTPFMGSSLNVALPALGNEFNINALLLSWIPTSYLLAAAICLVPIGRIADIIGRQKVFFYGVIIFGIFSLLCSMAKDFIFFILCRIFQGIGGAMIFGTAVAILTGVFPIQQRGRVLGINVAGVYLGLSLGPFLGGILTQNLGWQSIFYVNSFLSFLMFFLIIFFLKIEKEKITLKNFDYTGTLFYSPMLFLLMYGFSLLPKISGVVLLLIGIIFILVFIKYEMSAVEPLLNINLFKANSVFLFSNLAALINYSATSAVSFLLSLYLQYIKGYLPQQAGIILIAQPVTMTILSPLAGRLSDRIQPQVIASTGMGLTGFGLFFLSFISSSTTVDFVTIFLILLGLGFALFSSPNTNAVMSSVERENYGIASSTLATMRLLGQMSSMGIVMLIFSLILGRVKINPDVYPLFLNALRIAFYIFTGLCIFGVYASLKRGKIKRN
ncbi:MAG: MFS transporter [bacterium]